MEVYENHLGGIYFSEYEFDYDDLYCEQCGDSDSYLGYAETWDAVLDLLTEEYKDGESWVRYDADYLKEMKKEFETRIKKGS